ncbi:MAG: pilin [Patescibacteria group bacterium]
MKKLLFFLVFGAPFLFPLSALANCRSVLDSCVAACGSDGLCSLACNEAYLGSVATYAPDPVPSGHNVQACVDPAPPSTPPPSNASANLPSTNGTTTLSDANKPVTLINPLGTTDPREIIGNLIKAVISIIGSITLLMFVYGGVLWITSMGDDKKVMKGKQILVWCVAGLAIIAGAYALTNAVISGLTTGSVIPTTATGGSTTPQQ